MTGGQSSRLHERGYAACRAPRVLDSRKVVSPGLIEPTSMCEPRSIGGVPGSVHHNCSTIDIAGAAVGRFLAAVNGGRRGRSGEWVIAVAEGIRGGAQSFTCPTRWRVAPDTRSMITATLMPISQLHAAQGLPPPPPHQATRGPRRRRELRIPSRRATGALAFQAVYLLPPPPQPSVVRPRGHSWVQRAFLSEGCAYKDVGLARQARSRPTKSRMREEMLCRRDEYTWLWSVEDAEPRRWLQALWRRWPPAFGQA